MSDNELAEKGRGVREKNIRSRKKRRSLASDWCAPSASEPNTNWWRQTPNSLASNVSFPPSIFLDNNSPNTGLPCFLLVDDIQYITYNWTPAPVPADKDLSVGLEDGGVNRPAVENDRLTWITWDSGNPRTSLSGVYFIFLFVPQSSSSPVYNIFSPIPTTKNPALISPKSDESIPNIFEGQTFESVEPMVSTPPHVPPSRQILGCTGVCAKRRHLHGWLVTKQIIADPSS